jgi:hypothetical protein
MHAARRHNTMAYDTQPAEWETRVIDFLDHALHVN